MLSMNVYQRNTQNVAFQDPSPRATWRNIKPWESSLHWSIGISNTRRHSRDDRQSYQEKLHICNHICMVKMGVISKKLTKYPISWIIQQSLILFLSLQWHISFELLVSVYHDFYNILCSHLFFIVSDYSNAVIAPNYYFILNCLFHVRVYYIIMLSYFN